MILVYALLACLPWSRCMTWDAAEARRAELLAQGGDDGRSALAGMRQRTPFPMRDAPDGVEVVHVGEGHEPPEVWARGDEIFLVVTRTPNLESVVLCDCTALNQGHRPPVWGVEGHHENLKELVLVDSRKHLQVFNQAGCPDPP